MKILQNSDIPIYMQIASQFKEDILSNKYKDGEYLPSIRSLAKELKISVITTMKAYEQLQTEGLIIAVQGKGYYVNAKDNAMIKEQHIRQIEESLLLAIKAAKIIGMSNNELINILKTLQSIDDY